MSMSFVVSMNRGKAKGAEGQIASKNTQTSRQVREMRIQKATQGEGMTSSKTKGFARKAYSLSISGAALARGPWYPKPQ
uniref:Uncharacterized protein n=1 Tax=Magnetococcus massalia (strain MO-1) TaxID=451514 RepID=A0A1S7LJ46_MAGMO|nr:Protein of unknown function [Candidatus Magnetococcus massalia]